MRTLNVDHGEVDTVRAAAARAKIALRLDGLAWVNGRLKHWRVAVDDREFGRLIRALDKAGAKETLAAAAACRGA